MVSLRKMTRSPGRPKKKNLKMLLKYVDLYTGAIAQ